VTGRHAAFKPRNRRGGFAKEESAAVREAVLDFYRGVSAKAVERFDDIVSAEPATLVIGTAPGEWVTERCAEPGASLRPAGYLDVLLRHQRRTSGVVGQTVSRHGHRSQSRGSSR
jgi:hypothetical protein